MRLNPWRRPGRPAPDTTVTTPAPSAASSRTDAVEEMRQWTEAARDLDKIRAEDHADTLSNPDTVAEMLNKERQASLAEIKADAERRCAELAADKRRRDARAEREQVRIDAQAQRERRALDEAVADADEASADLEMIRAWERESSPVTASRSLARSARRWRGADLGYSVVGSALSATGLAAALVAVTPLPLAGAAGVAVALEAVMTVRVVDLIGRVARMDEQNKSDEHVGSDSDNNRTHLIVQAVVVLSASVLANLVGLAVGSGALGAVGVLGALLAAAAGLGSHASTSAASSVIRRNLAAFKGEGWTEAREEMRRRASGAYMPAPADESTEDADERPNADQGRRLERLGFTEEERGLVLDMIAAYPDLLDEALGEDMGQSMDARVAAELAATPLPEHPGDLIDGTGDYDEATSDAGGGVDEEGVDTPAQGTQNPVSTPEWTQGGGDSANGVNTPSGAPEDAGGGHRLSDVNASRSEAARRRLSEAVRLIRDRGEEPTKTAVRRETGMDLRTISRHWDAVTKRNEEEQ